MYRLWTSLANLLFTKALLYTIECVVFPISVKELLLCLENFLLIQYIPKSFTAGIKETKGLFPIHEHTFLSRFRKNKSKILFCISIVRKSVKLYNRMIEQTSIAKGLRVIIAAILAGSHSRKELNCLIGVSHSLAASFLASKATTESLISVYDLTTSDLAYDCIADLFQEDGDGKYRQLQAYFAGLSIATARDEEILIHLRRLVFSKVNQSIFRLYSEADPSLSKILRNIKLAIHSLKNFEEIERFGEPCIVPSLCDTLVHLPPFEREELEHCFLHIARGDELIPDLLAKLSLLLREQIERCRILPFVGVGILFRTVYEKKELAQPEIGNDRCSTCFRRCYSYPSASL